MLCAALLGRPLSHRLHSRTAAFRIDFIFACSLSRQQVVAQQALWQHKYAFVPQHSSQHICSRRRASRTAAGITLSILRSSEAQQSAARRAELPHVFESSTRRMGVVLPSTLQVLVEDFTAGV